MKVGDTIKITACDDNQYYKVGDIGTIIKISNDVFKADLTANDHIYMSGLWWLTEPGTKFKLHSQEDISQKIEL